MRNLWLALGLGGLLPLGAAAQTPARPVVVELFTSQGCSSCPPADALVAGLAASRPDLLPLTFHVTYWNNLGWQDPFSFAAATERQRRYVGLGISPEVYTPAMVVDGRADAIGSDRAAVNAALAQAVASHRAATRIDAVRTPSGLTIDVAAGTGSGAVLVIGYDRQHQTQVGRGENSGRTLVEANIVRSMSQAALWTGPALHLHVPLPPGEEAAILVQAEDGPILGAARATASGRDQE